MEKFGLNLKSVTKFTVVQSNDAWEDEDLIEDEKDFSKIVDAVDLLSESQAPLKFIKFYLDGKAYRMFPIEDSDEFDIMMDEILN